MMILKANNFSLFMEDPGSFLLLLKEDETVGRLSMHLIQFNLFFFTWIMNEIKYCSLDIKKKMFLSTRHNSSDTAYNLLLP